jgi:hypothetical protein
VKKLGQDMAKHAGLMEVEATLIVDSWTWEEIK